MTIDIEALQKRALQDLADASANVIRKAMDLHATCGAIADEVRSGHHARSMNHQEPFDLARCLANREAAIRMCGILDCDRDAINKASTGEDGF